MNKRFLVLIVSCGFCLCSSAQVFSGFSAFKHMIEFEGQRYLMTDIYKITSTDYDKLRIDKTIVDIDEQEGFMFVLTSYQFNEKSGVVISAFNSRSYYNNKYDFTDVHLTDSEFRSFYNEGLALRSKNPPQDMHYLKAFNERLAIDVWYDGVLFYFTIWVDNNSRHTLEESKWSRAFSRYEKFLTK